MLTAVSLIWIKRALRVVALLMAAGLVLGLFVGGAQPVAVGLIQVPWDKLAHAAVFAVLAICIGCASGMRGRSLVVFSFFAATCVGAIDEWHQMHLPGRAADWSDLFFDAAGAALGSFALICVDKFGAKMVRHF